tara:strand:- start:5481 stop:5732 length:252 start_codon:yes stop_codon:yes gene_type:complete
MTKEELSQSETRKLYGRYYTSKECKKKIDYLLWQCAVINANTGSDSTDAELLEAKKQKNILYDNIKKIDPIKYESLTAGYERE